MAGSVGDFTFDPNAMKSAAEGILTASQQYWRAYEGMSQSINNLKSSWTSEDGNAYIAKINSFRDSFQNLKNALDKCSETISTDAQNYLKAQQANMVK